MAEGLALALGNTVDNNDLQPLKVCQRAPGISHLLFADDSLLFFKACPKQALCVRQALDLFQKSTGQSISPSKCSLLFGQQSYETCQEEIKSILQVQNTSFEEKYLGLPVPEGRMKAERFQPTKERSAKHLTGWSERYMSLGGKEVLIKSVA